MSYKTASRGEFSHRAEPPPNIQQGRDSRLSAKTVKPIDLNLDPAGAVPQTFLIECNRNTAPNVDNGLNNDPSSWVCNFEGGIELKKGDAISINSATLNSVGVGDLINFTLTNEANTQDNTATWIHSFYVVNDGKNDKRASCNMNAASGGAEGVFRYDTTNNDCDVFRFTDIGAECEEASREVSYFQDKFMPLRVGETDPYVSPVDSIVDIAGADCCAVIYSDNFEASFGAQAGNFSYFSVNSVAADGTVGAIQDLRAKNIFQRGRNYAMVNVNIPSLNNPAQYNDATTKVIFGVIDAVENVGNSVLNAPDGVYIKCTPFGLQIFDNIGKRQSATTVSIGFYPLTGEVNFANNYAYCPVFYNWEDQLFNKNDDVYLINYELLDPVAFGDKQVQGIQSNGSVAKGKVSTSNVFINDIANLSLPTNEFDGDQGFPIQGYDSGTFSFKLKGITFDSLNDMVTYNNGYKHFGIRVYTAEGYKYGFFYIGIDGDSSTLTNNNILNISFDGGIQVYFGVDEFQTLNDQSIEVLNKFLPDPVTSESNPHQILFIGKLTDQINVRYYNTVRQFFTGNFTPNKNLRNPSAINQEAYWSKQPFNDATILLNNDTTVFNPAHITGYTGGLMRNFDFFLANDSTRAAQFQGNNTYIKHYEHFKLEIDSTWNSPSDVATKLTDQTHAIQKARDNIGNIIPNSEGAGIPHNRLCIPVWTTGSTSEADLIVNNNLTDGSFKIVDTYTNVGVTPPFKGDGGAQTHSGNVDIFFRTQNTSINYPSVIKNDGSTDSVMPCDFNQGNSLMGNTDYIRTAKSRDADNNVVGFPIQYINGQNAYISQFAGANDISFGWDDNLSRFTIGNLHLGIYSVWDSQVTGGGQQEIKIYVPSIPYKKNQVRSGGIKVQNWYSSDITDESMGLQTIIENNNLDFDFNFTDDWFLSNNNRSSIGERFWNKLGYSESQVGVGGSLEGGTTQNEVDSSVNITESVEPAANRPAYQDRGNFADSKSGGGTDRASAPQAFFEYSSVGNLNFNNHAVGMGGIPNTEGAPIQFEPAVNFASGFQRTGKTTGITSDEQNKYINSEANYNPDREMHTYYTVSTQDNMTTTLDAQNLPIKTKFSYFYILSDLVEANFYSSKNGGMPINCVGTINKLNSENDFYFSYSSPQRIYVTKDRVVTSITTTIRNTDFSSPALISDNSSVIYQVDRFNPQPSKMPPTIADQQNMFFARMSQLIENVLGQNKLPDSEEDVEQVLEELFVGGDPTDNTAEIVEDIINEGEELEQELVFQKRAADADRIRDLYNKFLESRDPKQKVSKREFVDFMNEVGVPDDIIEEAKGDYKSLEQARRGIAQEQRGGRVVDPELASRLRATADLRFREFEGRERPPPAYVTPPAFTETGEDVEDPQGEKD